jgi:hypothetical protein
MFFRFVIIALVDCNIEIGTALWYG